MIAALSDRDRLDILDLAARYCHATDSSDAAGFAGLFTDDGEFRSSRFEIRGTRQLEEFVASERLVERGLLHCCFNHVIEAVADREARMRCYVLVSASPAPGQATPVIERHGVYDDQLVRTDLGWRLRRRVFRSVSQLALQSPAVAHHTIEES